MTTPQMVFEITMALTDNLNDAGDYDTNDTKEYKNRTLAILNSLLNEVFPYSDTYKRTEKGKRPICPYLTRFDEEIGVDDAICRGILTEGLAALLFQDENPEMANTHLQIYYERLAALKSGAGMPVTSTDIVDVYDGGYEDENGDWVKGNMSWPYNHFSRW